MSNHMFGMALPVVAIRRPSAPSSLVCTTTGSHWPQPPTSAGSRRALSSLVRLATVSRDKLSDVFSWQITVFNGFRRLTLRQCEEWSEQLQNPQKKKMDVLHPCSGR